MKILHTADWHIGKKLHKHDLLPDFRHFAEWLVTLIREREVDVLLLSGDVFDLANPGSEARREYYHALLQISRTGCRIVITGGNHDSPAVLNAPRELLRQLGIFLVGTLPENAEELLIPLGPNPENPAVVVAALPYLRDADLRKDAAVQHYDDRLKAVQEGIAHNFERAAQACRERYPDVPALAMGHLFAAGVSSSDSERDIQVGNEALFDAGHFPAYFQYIALGHIHKPQQLKAAQPAYYSGSPLPLSFSESEDPKRVLLLDTQKSWDPESIAVPPFRKLQRLRGSLAQIREELYQLAPSDTLPTLLEIEMRETHYDPARLRDLEHLCADFDRPGLLIAKYRATFEDRATSAAALYEQGEVLEDLQSSEVFEKMLEQMPDQREEDRQLLREAFEELLEEVLRDEENPSS